MKENMISGQFLPGLIKNRDLLKVFNDVEREKYLPNNYKHLAYSDKNIKVEKEKTFNISLQFSKNDRKKRDKFEGRCFVSWSWLWI